MRVGRSRPAPWIVGVKSDIAKVSTVGIVRRATRYLLVAFPSRGQFWHPVTPLLRQEHPHPNTLPRSTATRTPMGGGKCSTA